MLKKLLIVTAIVLASPTFIFADDIFFAFGQGASATDTSLATTGDGVGSVFVYSDGQFAFDAAELTFTNSDSSVLQFTGGEAFNPALVTASGIQIGTRFQDNGTSFDLDATNPGTLGELELINVTQFGVSPNTASLDLGFDAAVGSDGAFLLARVDYNIVGTGTATFDLSLGERGAVLLDDSTDPIDTIVLSPSLGSATLTVATPAVIPEPSSMTMLVLGAVGLVARRRRA